MTKTTEELKRTMYLNLPQAKTVYGAENFENALEEYLEALRQEAVSLAKQGGILLDAYTHQQELTRQARAEAESLRNRAQAFEFANQSAGEFLQASRAKVRAQRQSIGQLKNERDNAQHALKVKTSKLEKALQELSELRKISKAPTSSQEASLADDINPYGAEMQIASCRAAVGRWQTIGGTSDRQTLIEIVSILREIPE